MYRGGVGYLEKDIINDSKESKGYGKRVTFRYEDIFKLVGLV